VLDERGQSMIRRELAGFVAAHETGSSCPALIGFLRDAVMTPEQRKTFGAAKPSEASVTGDTAKVRVESTNYWLTRTNGACGFRKCASDGIAHRGPADSSGQLGANGGPRPPANDACAADEETAAPPRGAEYLAG